MTSALDEYANRRATVGRGRLPADPADCARAQLEALGPARARQWLRDLTRELGFDIPDALVVDLARLPDLAREAVAYTPNADRVLGEIEDIVVTAVATLTGHPGRCVT